MLGLALSVGASGAFLSNSEEAIAADLSADAFLLAAALPPDVAQAAADGSASQAATYHTVEEGESLWQIAQVHQVDVQTIKAANGISLDEVLKVGQVLKVPATPDVRLPLEDEVKDAAATAEPSIERLALANTTLPRHTAETGSKASSGIAPPEAASDEQSEVASLPLENQPLTAGQENRPDGRENLAVLPNNNSPEANTLTSAAALSEPAVQPQLANPVPTVSPESFDQDSSWVSRSIESAASSSVVETPVETPTVVPSAGASAVELTTEENSAPIVTVAPIAKAQRLAALGEAVEPSQAEAQTLVPVVPAQTYRVKPGDTIWTIASRYGVDPEELASTNGVRNPNLIIVGDTIQIPSGQNDQLAAAARSGEAPAAVAVPVVPAQPGTDDYIARIREAASAPMDREVLYERIRQARQVEDGNSAAVAEPVAESRTEATAIAANDLPASLPLNGTVATADRPDPHVANLIAEIRAMQRQRTTEALAPKVEAAPTELVVATPALDASEAPANPEPVATLAAAPVNPEFAPAQPAAAPAAPSRELLAAAPLSPEAYAPAMVAPTGRTVAPNMPILPGADQFLPDAPERFDGYMWPAQGVLTSGYGWRWGRMHQGVDIAAPVGTPIFAAAPGVVVRSGWNSGGYGNLVDIRHADGSLTRYAHNSRLLVRAGQEVRQGQQIAEMGSTGYSTGPHLHFEIHLPGSGTVNPVAHLPGR